MTIADYPAYEVTKFITYLNNLKEEAIRINGNEEIINISTEYFWKMFDYFGSTDNGTLEIPDCCPNNGSQGDFHVMYTWDKNEHYLEVEIKTDYTAEFFYRNHLTKEVWGEDCTQDKPFSQDTIEKLSLFVE